MGILRQWQKHWRIKQTLKTINLKNIFCGLVFCCLLFIFIATGNQFIDKGFNLIDEGVLVLLYWFIWRNRKSSAIRENNILILIWTLFMLTGFVGSIVWAQQKWLAILVDAFLVTNKFMMTYLGSYIFFEKNKDFDLETIAIPNRIIVVGLFLISIHDLLFNPWFAQVGNRRLFFNTQSLCFPHPTFLTHAAVTLLIFFGYLSIKSKKVYPIEMFMASWLILVAARAKGIGFLALFWMLFIFFFIIKIKQLGLMLAVGAVSAIAFGADLIVANYMKSNVFSPRKVLFVDSVKVMNSNFLFGTGFASFVSSMANKFYSPLYKEFGYMFYTGMNPNDQQFLSDGFWPTILAQFGWIGLILFGITLVIFVRKTYYSIQTRRESGFVMLMVLAYSLISSMAETSFFNPISMALFILFAYAEVHSKKVEENMND